MRLLRHLPNAVTALRLLAIPLMLWLATVGARDAFAALVIASLVGDVVDGALARRLRAVTPLGAQLDSVADTLLFLITVAGIVLFFPDDIRAHAVAFIAAPAAWFTEVTIALVRYGRLSSFHTYLSRAAAVAMAVFIAALFAVGMRPWLLQLASALVVIATVEELVLLWMLPAWTPDVRGVWWVVRPPRSHEDSKTI